MHGQEDFIFLFSIYGHFSLGFNVDKLHICKTSQRIQNENKNTYDENIRNV